MKHSDILLYYIIRIYYTIHICYTIYILMYSTIHIYYTVLYHTVHILICSAIHILYIYSILYIYYVQIGISMKQADILLLIDAFDSDGDGRVSIQEFIEFIGRYSICMHMCMYDCTYYMLSACMMYDRLYR